MSGEGAAGTATAEAIASAVAKALEGRGSSASEVSAAVTSAVKDVIASEGAKHREAKRALQKEIDDLKAKLPGEGKAVVSASDAALLEAAKAIETDPEKLKTRFEVGDTAVKAEAQRVTDRAILEVVGVAYAQPQVFLSAVPDARGWSYETKTEDVDGQAVQVAYVRTSKDATPERLTDRVEKDETLKLLIPSLTAESDNGDGTRTAAKPGQGVRSDLRVAPPGALKKAPKGKGPGTLDERKAGILGEQGHGESYAF